MPVDVRDRFSHRQRSALLTDLLQRLASRILHDDETFAAALHEVVNADDFGCLTAARN